MRRAAVAAALLAAGALLAGCTTPGGPGRPTTTTVPQGPGPAEPQETPPAAKTGDIYTPPNPLPPGKPGDVIWYQQAANWQGARIIKVLYRSVDAMGQPMPVTGTVMVPNNRANGSPIVGFAAETVGLTDDCAPSKQYSTFLESTQLTNLLRSGYTVAMTDYEGLGTTHKLHTYMVGPSQAHAVLDMLRAALRTPGTGLPADAPMALWGYSQGGGAVGAAAEAAAEYAPELPIKGAAAGGVPADLVAVANFLNGGIGFGFLAGAAIGFDTAYPELNLDSYLNQNGRTQLNRAVSGSMCLWALLTNYAFQRIDNYTTRNPLQDPAWQARLNESKLGSKPPRFPVYLYHALYDEVIPYGQANALRQNWCRGGTRVQWTQYALAEHLLGANQGGGGARQWLADRFAGRNAPSNC